MEDDARYLRQRRGRIYIPTEMTSSESPAAFEQIAETEPPAKALAARLPGNDGLCS